MSAHTSKPKSSLLVKILVVVSLFAFVAVAQTSEAPSDGPLPKVTTRNQQGEISAVKERIR